MKVTMRSTATRRDELDQLLQARRRALQSDLQARVRDGRSPRSPEVRDMVDLCDVGIEEELSFALLQMRHETLTRIETALARLGDGRYGACCECGIEISEGRLRALPFAVRCRHCEDRHERRQARSRQEQRRDSMPLFPL